MKLTQSQIDKLKELVEKIDEWLKQNDNLAKHLQLRKKFIGPLGEALTLIRLYEEVNPKNVDFNWQGARRKGYDIEITTKNDKKIRVQVKTSYDDPKKGFSFSVFTFTNIGKNERTILKDEYKVSKEKFKLPEKIKRIFDEQVDKKFDDKGGDIRYYWVLVSRGENGDEFFILDKKHFKSLLKQDYERYIKKTSHRKDFNYGISKAKKLRIIFKRENVGETLQKYKNGWDKISRNLR